MNRALRRANLSGLRSEGRRPWEPFERIPETERPELFARQRRTTGDLRSVWKNNRYIVQIYARVTEAGEALQLACRRNDEEPIEGWDDLQRMKNEIVGADRIAIEIYPAASNVIDQANMRHLFVLPEGQPAPFTIEGRWL